MNEACSCGLPRQRGTFCRECYPKHATPEPAQHCDGCTCRPEREARPPHPNTQIGRLNR